MPKPNHIQYFTHFAQEQSAGPQTFALVHCSCATLPFARENMTVKRCCPKGINWWCWHTWSTNIKLWLRAKMATNSRSNTIVEQMSATNRCLRTAPILRRSLGRSLPCDIWRCFQQMHFWKHALMISWCWIFCSCCISTVCSWSNI